MNNSKEEKFRKRFGDRIKCSYSKKPKDIEEKQFLNKRLSEALINVMADILGRQPTKEELLGKVPLMIKNDNSNMTPNKLGDLKK